MKRKATTPTAPLDLPQPSLYNQTELERAEKSLKKIDWSPEEFAANVARLEAKRSRYVKEKPFNIPQRRGGKGA